MPARLLNPVHLSLRPCAAPAPVGAGGACCAACTSSTLSACSVPAEAELLSLPCALISCSLPAFWLKDCSHQALLQSQALILPAPTCHRRPQLRSPALDCSRAPLSSSPHPLLAVLLPSPYGGLDAVPVLAQPLALGPAHGLHQALPKPHGGGRPLLLGGRHMRGGQLHAGQAHGRQPGCAAQGTLEEAKTRLLCATCRPAGWAHASLGHAALLPL